jgi:hypothetical protein
MKGMKETGKIIKIVFGKYIIKGNPDRWSKWSASEGGVVRWSQVCRFAHAGYDSGYVRASVLFRSDPIFTKFLANQIHLIIESTTRSTDQKNFSDDLSVPKSDVIGWEVVNKQNSIFMLNLFQSWPIE